MTYVGVDWAEKGWVAVEWDGDDSWNAGVYPTILNVWHEYEDGEGPILVDIPIGLAEGGRRKCDEEAKGRLDGSRGSSVFWTPCREAVEEPNLIEAKRINEERSPSNDSISRQSWALVPRIREVDAFLAEIPDARGRVRESHPEVCFTELDVGDRITERKTDEAGREQRLEVLDQFVGDGEDAEATFDRFMKEMREDPPDGAPILNANSEDDLVDAMALAVTAKLGAESGFTVLGGSEGDEGRPMEIVCPKPEAVEQFA